MVCLKTTSNYVSRQQTTLPHPVIAIFALTLGWPGSVSPVTLSEPPTYRTEEPHVAYVSRPLRRRRVAHRTAHRTWDRPRRGQALRDQKDGDEGRRGHEGHDQCHDRHEEWLARQRRGAHHAIADPAR